MRSPRRRDLLGLAAGTTATLAAGCLSTGDGPTESTDGTASSTTDESTETGVNTDVDGEITATIDGNLEYTEWYPAPASLDVSEYWTYFGDLATLRDANVSEDAVTRVDEIFQHVPSDVVDEASITRFASIARNATVCAFDADASAIHDRLDEMAKDVGPTESVDATATESGEGTAASGDDETDPTTSEGDENDGAPEGYLGFRFELGVLFLGADHLVYAQKPALAEAMVEAHAGERDRYAENPDFAVVTEGLANVDLGSAAVANHQYVSDSRSFSYRWSLGDPVELTAAFAFEDASSTDRSSVSAIGELAGFAEYENQETTTDGRVVEFTGTIAPSEFDLFERDDGGKTETASADRPPQVAFGFDFWRGKDDAWDGDEEERVVVTHEGGDSIQLDQVALHYDGTPVSETARVAETRPSGETWQAGGEWRLRDATTNATFESGVDVTIVWESDDGSSAAVIGQGTLP